MIVKRSRKLTASSAKQPKVRRRYIKAAEEDEDFDFDNSDGLLDAIDDVADNVEDLHDALDDVEEDDVEINVNNNIGDHYLAECEYCNGVFISAVVESDQELKSVSGICPLCGKEGDQFLKWIIKDVVYDEEEDSAAQGSPTFY